MGMRHDTLQRIPPSGFFLSRYERLNHAEEAPSGFLIASGGVSSQDWQLPGDGRRRSARRRPEYDCEVHAATRSTAVCPHTWPDLTSDRTTLENKYVKFENTMWICFDVKYDSVRVVYYACSIAQSASREVGNNMAPVRPVDQTLHKKLHMPSTDRRTDTQAFTDHTDNYCHLAARRSKNTVVSFWWGGWRAGHKVTLLPRKVTLRFP